MDKNKSQVIDNFEFLLKKQTSRKLLRLYSSSDTQSKPRTEHDTYSVQDVLMNVSKQIKAMQNADVPSSKRSSILYKYKNKEFLTVDMMPVNKEAHQHKHTKFETQCVSDTQLINIIENAEIIDKNTGVTQEFDTTFCQKSDDSDSGKDKQMSNNKIVDVKPYERGNVSLDDVDANSTNMKVNKDDTSEMDTLTCIKCDIVSNDDSKPKDNHHEIQNDDPKCDHDTGRSTSPVLNAKRITPPLIFSLYTFEKFENLAHPIIEEHTDLQTAKNIINSQIVGSELFIPNPINESDDKDGPVLNNIEDISLNNNENIAEKNTIKSDEKVIPNSPEIFDVVENDDENPTQPQVVIKTEFKDEILFSSDEENEYLHKKVQELPLTCAIETSFYETSDVLDKTMYVGFQTASNKSIQISTDSFIKAKSILGVVGHDTNDATSLQDLVAIFDTDREKGINLLTNLSSRANKASLTITENINSIKCNKIEEESRVTFKNECLTALEEVKENNDDILISQVIPFKSIATSKLNKSISDIFEESVIKTKRKLEGFKTASNKRIKLSDKALARCKKVFQDINFDDTNCETDFDQDNVNIAIENQTDDMNVSQDIFEVKEDIGVKDANSDKLEFKNEVFEDFHISDQEFLQEFEDNEMPFEKTIIDLSNSSVAKAKKIFHDIIVLPEESKTYNKLNNEDEIQFKRHKVSKKAFIKPKESPLDVEKRELDLDNFDFAKPSTSKFLGFKTAANKDIKISLQPLEKLKDFYKEIDTDFNTDVNNDNLKQTKEINPNTEELGSNVEKTPKNTEDLFAEELVLNEDFFKDSVIESKETEIPVFKGFQTANKKAIKISEKALQMSKKLFEDITSVENLTEDSTTENQNIRRPGNAANKIAKQKDELNNKENVEASIPFTTTKYLESKETEIPVFKGFQTANNKSIKISEKALQMSKKLFEDITSVENLTKDIEDQNIQRTGNDGKKIEKQKDEFNNKENVDTSIPLTTTNDLEDKSLNKRLLEIKNTDAGNVHKETPVFKGFRTASNKKVLISDESLAKSKKLFQDNNLIQADYDNVTATEKSKELVIQKICKNNDTNKFVGFKTASSKPISISTDALAKSESVFKDIDFEDITHDNDHVKRETSDLPTKCVGFHTASNKEIKISEKALAKSKQILNDMEFDDVNKDKPVGDFVGFKTANNKKVKISKDALVKSKQFFNDFELNKDNINDKATEDVIGGFKTANNNEVRISKSTLDKTKQIFNEIEFKNCALNEEPEIRKFVGFKTASNKKVKISDEALAKSDAIFKDINEGGNSLKAVEITDKSPLFKGFQTASNKQVKVSEKALEKSRKLFHDIDVCKNNENEGTGNENIKVFSGFQTASNKKVEISEKAIAMTKTLFDGIEFSQKELSTDGFHSGFKKKIEDDNSDDAEKGFKGFQTASNKKVVVSEQAMARTKAVFNDELNEPIKSTITADFKLEKATKVTKYTSTEVKLHKTDLNKDIIDTQVLNDFQDSLNTEDFCKSTPKSKRSGSPILSCPRAKKRKFETPYRNDKKIQPANSFIPPKLANTYQFKEDYKKNKVYTLKDLQKLQKDAEIDIDPYITKFNLDTMLNFEFFGARNDYTNGKFNVNEIKKLFLDAVNKKIVPDGWLDNHIKLVIWKLLSYEVKFPTVMKNVCSVKNVMDQLKYRYDRELYNVQRPILRKILEKDDVPSKTMVLCVAAIYVEDVSVTSIPTQSNNTELLLTDGWYCVRAVIDRMLAQLVCNGSIVVGCKIATSNAELVNCEQGMAPWEDTSSVRLKLHGNSTRRARWLRPLGACGGAVACGLRARAGGGRGAAVAVLARVYPRLAVLKGEGGAVILSERLEQIRLMKQEEEQQALMEKLYEELEKELADQESQDSESYTNDKSNCFDSGSQISKMVKRSRDPDEYRSHLTASQNGLLEEYNQRKREKKMEVIRAKFQEKLEKCGMKKENVAHVLKVRLVDYRETGSGVEVNKGYLSIWNPSGAVMELMTEGTWIEILNFIPTGMRNSEIQLSAGRQTVFKPYTQKNEKYKLFANTLKRKCYEIRELTQNPNISTDYNEIDTVGIIFEIEPSTKDFDEKKQNFQNVFLADANKNMICVNFWGGLKKFGFENILDTGQIVTCVNLQKRAGNSRKSIPQYRVTEFTYFTKTPKDKRASELTSELSEKLTKIKEKFCEDCLVLKNNYSTFKTRNVENVSPYRFGNNTPKRLESPMNCDMNLNLTGLDFESSFTTQMSPEQLRRKKRVKEKIEKLKMYGEPPPLSSIHIINKSKNASATYKSPLISKDKVANSEYTPINATSVGKENLRNDASPVGLNRTFVKKVHPIKLNFSNSVAIENDLNDSVDHFADEFEASPPLSLDSDVAF
ncbi:hypothetical protein MSG28_015477 [Choristoneura fumiferana]|uniref:Uncharacterized protein n=1 Tax=Choristoneura fumiferana TaxID=7141 RepID=A0ACC0KBL1_CHOFU|nr:hypothetical protein MSG28_015477 [Choristoneura fumiferana]